MMVKSLFLEFKFGQIDLELLRSVDFNHLIVGLGHLVPVERAWEQWLELKRFSVILGISRIAFDHGGCPADPAAKVKLFDRIDQALSLNPQEIWLDHFRFDGRWESIGGLKVPRTHPECQFCRGLNRSEFLLGIAQAVSKRVGGRAKVGYFAVPFMSEEIPEVIGDLGQDHRRLRKIFDLCSPMIYQRMIERPVAYIGQCVRYLHQQLPKPVLPIIQVKDMPDDLPDNLKVAEIRQEFNEAVKPPSLGVCFFSWDHAVEKGKVGTIQELFASV